MNWIGIKTLIWRDISRLSRVVVQALVTPWVSALLYILVFGKIVGQRIQLMNGFSYIDFVLPGLVMMNLIGSSFMATTFALYFARFTRNIEELLVAPFSYNEMIFSYTATGIIRGFIVGLGVFLMAIFFGAANMAHFWLFMFYSLSVATIFSFVGILVALWAKNFEQLSVLSTFVITPLSFLGGVFNSIHMMPASLQWFVRINPFFYFVDGLRYSMIGYSESNRTIGVILILVMMVGMGLITWSLFKKGYKIRA